MHVGLMLVPYGMESFDSKSFLTGDLAALGKGSCGFTVVFIPHTVNPSHRFSPKVQHTCLLHCASAWSSSQRLS